MDKTEIKERVEEIIYANTNPGFKVFEIMKVIDEIVDDEATAAFIEGTYVDGETRD